MQKPGRFLKERGWADSKDLPKGPNGRPLCRHCSKETEPPRRTFCSDKCVEEWKIRSNGGFARDKVMERDRGVCKRCGLDTEKLRELLYKVRTQKGEMAYINLTLYYEATTGYAFLLEKHAWEADHVVSVADGGGSCTLDNLETLCVPCHRKKTKEWHRNQWKRRAKFKKRSG